MANFFSDHWEFLRQFRERFETTGAVAPSSVGLAKRMLETIDFGQSKAIVEFGPGPGNMTASVS